MASEFRISDGIVFVTFSGILSSDALRDAFQRMAEIEAESDPVPNRLVDISATEGVNLNFNSMMGLADMRMKAPLKNATKTAVVTGNLVQHGFARMFHTLKKKPISRYRSSQVKVKVWPGCGPNLSLRVSLLERPAAVCRHLTPKLP